MYVLSLSICGGDIDIDNDMVLYGVDSATEKAMNAPRVANLVAAFVNGTPQRYQTFLTVVRCLRQWAKARGLYGNRMGYWGGINISIAVVHCLQLYPNACPATLLDKFFSIFQSWPWPYPVMLTKPHDAGYGFSVWDAQKAWMMGNEVAPIITPAYPAMNSTASVSRQSLQILQEEFHRGHEIVKYLWKQYQQNLSSLSSSSYNAPHHPLVNWSMLFQNSDFFINYPNYLSLCIVGPSPLETKSWAGFVDSRLRKLVSDHLTRQWPLKKIQLWPQKIEMAIGMASTSTAIATTNSGGQDDDQELLLTDAQRENAITYFIGFCVDHSQIQGNCIPDAKLALQSFRDWELSRYQPRLIGMDVLIRSYRVEELPAICFQDLYKGGKQEAMNKLRHRRRHHHHHHYYRHQWPLWKNDPPPIRLKPNFWRLFWKR